jgi:hypothetical protein
LRHSKGPVQHQADKAAWSCCASDSQAVLQLLSCFSYLSRAHSSGETCQCDVLPNVFVCCRAESRGSESSFLSGFVMGGVVFGALGFLLAPQVRFRCCSCVESFMQSSVLSQYRRVCTQPVCLLRLDVVPCSCSCAPHTLSSSKARHDRPAFLAPVRTSPSS